MTHERSGKVKSALESLIKSGLELQKHVSDDKEDRTKFFMGYQDFYTLSSELVKQIMPARYEEFCKMYLDNKRKEISFTTYTIQDYLNGLQVNQYRGGPSAFNARSVMLSKFQIQLTILMSLESTLDNVLIDLKTIIAADLYDSELDTCRGLHKSKHFRAAGAIAGVLLEKHLGKVSDNHAIRLAKKNPTISDYIEELKNSKIIDVVQWRGLQRLADIRNLAAHSKDRDPTPEEIMELIDGVDRVLKTIV